MNDDLQKASGRSGVLSRLHDHGYPRNALAALLLAASVGIYLRIQFTVGSGAFFYADELASLQDQRSFMTHAFSSNKGHVTFSVGPLWLGVLEVFGARSYIPFLTLATFLVVISSLLVGLVVSRMTTHALGIAATIWVLFLGPAFHNQQWSQASLGLVAVIALCLIGLIGARGLTGTTLVISLAILAMGAGGLGLSVGPAVVVLLLFLRRKLSAAILAGGISAVGILSLSSLTPPSGSAIPLWQRVSDLGYYVLSALVDTVAVGFRLPQAMAGVVSVALVALVLFSLHQVRRASDLTSQRILLLGATYLLFNWLIAGFQRGILEETAAPRYIGVTAPVLLVTSIASAQVCWSLMPLEWVAGAKRQLMLGLAIAALLLSTLGNIGSWTQSRYNVTYLGELNVARLGALHAARAWINPNFTPLGEGLGWVTSSAIEAAWSRHGAPSFELEIQSKGRYPLQALDAYVSTLLDAGWMQIEPSTTAPPVELSHCSLSLRFEGSDGAYVYYQLSDSPLQASMNESSQINVQTPYSRGYLTVHPIEDRASIELTTQEGCLIMSEFPLSNP